MTNKKAKALWEDTLLNGTKGSIVKTLGITKKAAKVFMSYTMPEMFVDNEINRVNLLRITELRKKAKRVTVILQEKQSSDLMLNIGLAFCFILVIPALVAIIYIKYIF